jgi:hypothetical protein
MPIFEDFETECNEIDEVLKKWDQEKPKNSLDKESEKSLKRVCV